MSPKGDSSKSSLQRLLALDKTYDTLEQRVDEAARILNIRLEHGQQPALATAGQVQRSDLSSYGRHEFVLRWILEKLKSQPEARSSVAAWSLAWHVVEDMSLASCVKALGSSGTMFAVRDALKERFPSDVQSSSTNDSLQEGQEPGKTGKKSKKRKSTSDNDASSQSIDLDSDVRLFANITMLVQVMVTKSSNAQEGQETILKHQMHAALRLDGEVRMQMMKHWLLALVCIAGRPTIKHLSSSAFLSSNISLLLDLWNLQALPTTSERDASVRSFCDECGWPLFLLLSLLKSDGDAQHPSVAVSSELRNAVEDLEHLFAAQALLPSRKAVLEPASTATETGLSPETPQLPDYIRPICEKIQALMKNKDSNVDGQNQLKIAQFGLSVMLDVAVRSVRFNTPKRKQHESPWVNGLVMSLQSLTGQDNSTTALGREFVSNGTLVGMLDILLEHKLPLSAESLTSIIERHCHLPPADFELTYHSLNNLDADREKSFLPPDFALLAKIVAMDAGIFTRDSNSTNSLAERVFRALAIYASFSRTDPPSLVEEPEAQAMIVLWRDQIAIPLMHAFARSRSLLRYLKLWHDHIPELRDEKHYREWILFADVELQTALQGLLEQFLTVEQITQVLKDLSDTYRNSCKLIDEPIDSDDENELLLSPASCDHDACWPSALQARQDTKFDKHSSVDSGFVILDAVLGAIHSDDLIRQLNKPFRCIFEHVLGYIRDGMYRFDEWEEVGEGEGPGELYHYAWSCLIRLDDLWLPITSAHTYSSQDSHANNSVGTVLAIGSTTKHTDLAAVEAAFLTMLKAMARSQTDDLRIKDRTQRRVAIALRYLVQFVATRNRMPDFQSVSKRIVRELCNSDSGSLREITFSDTEQDEPDDIAFGTGSIAAKYPLTLASVLSRYPGVWPLLSQNIKSEILSRVISSSDESADFRPVLNELITSICDSVSKTVGSQSSRTASIQDELFDSIMELAEKYPQQEWFATVLVGVWPESLLSSRHREAAINWTTTKLKEKKGQDSAETEDLSVSVLLSILIRMSEQPFGSPADVADGDRLWKLTDKFDLDDSAEEKEAQALFLRLLSNTFDAVDKWSEETRTAFLQTLSKRLAKELKKTKSHSITPLKLSVAAYFAAYTEKEQYSALKLPHRDPDIIEIFSKLLTRAESSCTAEPSSVMKEIPVSYWKRGSPKIESTLDAAIAQASRPLPASDRDKSAQTIEHYVENVSWALSASNMSGSDALQLVGSLVNLLDQQYLAPTTYANVCDAFTKACNDYTGDKMKIVANLIGDDSKDHPQALVLVNILINSISKSQLEVNGSLVAATRLVSILTARLAQESRIQMHSGLAKCITTVLRYKPFLINQHNLESLLACIHKLLTPASPALPPKAGSTVYTHICTIMQSMFQFHRQSLGGRIHLLTPILIQLTSCLFIPHKGSKNQTIFRHPTWLSNDKPLSSIHASRFARVLTLLCNPPQSTISRRRSGLVDETRKVRLYVGQHIQYVLHAFVRMLLHGRLGDGVREKLTPGLWAVIDVLDMSGSEEGRVQVLGASMNKAELALLRREYEAWKGGGSWKG